MSQISGYDYGYEVFESTRVDKHPGPGHDTKNKKKLM
jgi:hypothetical protein